MAILCRNIAQNIHDNQTNQSTLDSHLLESIHVLLIFDYSFYHSSRCSTIYRYPIVVHKLNLKVKFETLVATIHM